MVEIAAPLIVARPRRRSWRRIVGDVLLGGDRRVLPVCDRVLLGGQAERVEAHRVQHVVPVMRLKRAYTSVPMKPSGWPTCRPSPLGYGNMSSTNSFGRPATFSGSASGPAGFGASNVRSASQRSCQRSFDLGGERGACSGTCGASLGSAMCDHEASWPDPSVPACATRSCP